VLFYDGARHVAYLAFRGSINRNDWRTNLEIEQHATTRGVKCHRGFVAQYGRFRAHMLGCLRDLVARAPRSRFVLVVTGHSSGASMATLAMLDVSRVPGNIDAVAYLFSSPKTCNADVSGVSRVPVYHIHHRDDLVPLVPLAQVLVESGEIDETIYRYEPTGRVLLCTSPVSAVGSSDSFPLNHALSSIADGLPF
jgi:predicted lipase